MDIIMHKSGTVKWFNNEKGYGFISDGNQEYFCHHKSIQGTGYKTLSQNEVVQFKPGMSPKGAVAEEVIRSTND